MTHKGAKKQQSPRPGKGRGPATNAPAERRRKSAAKKQPPAALPKEPKGTGGTKGGGLH